MTPKWFTKDIAILIIRLAVGAVFITHGVSKLMHMGSTVGFFNSLGISAFWAYVVAIVETLGGLSVLVGVFIVPASVLLSVIMLVAIFGVKWKMGFSGGYEFDVTVLATLLGLIGLGAGKYSPGGSKHDAPTQSSPQNMAQ